MDVLRVEIEDDRNETGEVWVHDIPMPVSLADVAQAVSVLYPGTVDVHMFVTEVPDEG